MISNQNSIKKIWDIYVIFLTVVAAIEVPLRLVLDYPVPHTLYIFDLVVSGSFMLDVVLNFISAEPGKGSSKRRLALGARRYLRTWFLVDFLSAVPFDLFTGGAYTHLNRLFRLLRLLRLLRLSRVAQFMTKLGTTRSMNPVYMRLFFFVFWISLVAHWIACGWIALGGIAEDGAGYFRTYLRSLYFSVTTLTTVGYGDISPQSNTQTIFAIVVELVGAGLYGYIVGNVASILANIDVAKAHFAEKMEQVSAFLKYRNIPPGLQEKVHNYYDYLWESRLGYDESSVIEELPPSLRTEVSLYLNRDIIEKVPLFQGASDAFLREIVNILHPQVFTPGDFIIRKGEIGNEMFFISSGRVEVVSEDGTEIYATLGEGSYFGEIALINSEPRTASIRAAEYCDIYTLSREDLEGLLSRYPDVKEQLQAQAEKRIRELQLS